MKQVPYSFRAVQKMLDKAGLAPHKRWGQNFLLDAQAHRCIVETAEVQPDDAVVEIGPGLGHLTQVILQSQARLWAVEIDNGLYDLLQQNFGDCNSLRLLQMDIMGGKHSLNPAFIETLEHEIPENYKVIANLPYNIASPLLVNFLEHRRAPQKIVVTVQQEVAQRLVASPGSHLYGPLTLQIALYAEAEIVKQLPPQLFYPRPKVDSAIVVLNPRKLPGEIDYSTCSDLIRTTFCMRRKTLSKAIRRGLDLERTMVESILEECAIDPQKRAENLSLQEFIALAPKVAALLKKANRQ